MGNDAAPFSSRKHLTRIPVWLPPDRPVVYLVTICCARRRKLFTDPIAVRVGTECLIRSTTRWGWNVLKVCFMPDHVHLLLCPNVDRDKSLSKFIQAWKSSVVLRLAAHGIAGDIWQREFHDRLLRTDDKLEEKWEYIRLNPVRDGLCAIPEEYPYSGTADEILQRIP